MHIAKFGLISMSGQVAKLAASHDFDSYVNTMVFLQASHKTSEAVHGTNVDAVGRRMKEAAKPKKDYCTA